MDTIRKRNNIKISGNGIRPLLFAHGFIGDQNLWRLVAPAFREDYKIILFDYVGSGDSDPKAYDPQKYSRLEGYSQDVIDICESLKLEDVTFVGHSVSCMIGLIAAIRRPQHFARMIFIGPSPCYINDGNYIGGFDRGALEMLMAKMESDYQAWARQLAPVVLNAPDKPELSDELVKSLVSHGQKNAKVFATATFFSDYRKNLLELKIPTLIVQCSDDVMAPLEVGDYLHAHLDNSTIKGIEG